jgi:GxxExxY protein
LQSRGIAYQDNISVPVLYRGKFIRACKVKAICIANRILCGVTAIQDQITAFDMLRMRTYLKHSIYTTGLIINFGKSNLEIRAINH